MHESNFQNDKTLPESIVRIVCKVFEGDNAPEIFSSYTCENTSFTLSLSWNPNFNDRDFYSNNIIKWDMGDGTRYTSPSVKHYYKYPKTYNVSANVFDKNGESYLINLETPLTAKNVFPDYLYLHPLDSLGKPYNLPAGKHSDQIIVTRYNSWQNENSLKDNNYTVNLYVSGSKSDHITLSAYYTDKYSHLKAFHGFVSLSVDENNIIQSKIVESTRTSSVSVYAEPYTTGFIDDDWGIKFNFYNYPKEGTFFVGSSGSNYEIDYIYFVDQKPSNEVSIIYATFNEKNIKDYNIESDNHYNIFKKYDQGYLNLNSSAQVFKSIFNPASSIRITSNGISPEGSNTTIGKLSGQLLYPFDIYPIKWANTKIPFVINFKDGDNYSVKNYPPIYNYHKGKQSEDLYDINLKLVQFDDLNPLQQGFQELNAIELKDAFFEKNPSAPQLDDSPYFAGLLTYNDEAKVVAISASLIIKDEPVSKLYPIYGFLSQIGLSKVKRYQKRGKYSHCDTQELNFEYQKSVSTYTNSSTANVHISFCPLNFIDNNKENRVYILDADEDKIYRTDIDGNLITLIDLSSVRYLQNRNLAPIQTSFLNKEGSASPAWCSSDGKGNIYVSLNDTLSSIKINYETDIVSQVYYPPFENLELYDSDLYRVKTKDLVTINESKRLTRISNRNHYIVTINSYDQYYGFIGENTIIPSCIDVDIEDNVYIAYTHPLSNFICKYANNGELLDTFYFNKLEVPQEIIVDANNDIWVGIENINSSSTINDERQDIVYFINNQNKEKTIIRDIRGLGMMTIDLDQNLYVLNKTNTITKINSVNKTKEDFVFGKTSEESPYLKDIGALAVDSSGEMWIANNVDGKIYFADVKNMSKPLSALPTQDLIDLGLSTINGLGSIYFTMGDWTGFRWINKFLKTEIPKPRLISGLSTYFDILHKTPTVIKKGENLDTLTQFKSYIAQESLFEKNVLLDDFFGSILGNNKDVNEIGKVIYEKIENFVSNNIDVETCNLQKLFSMAEETGTDIKEYNYSYPPSIRRSMDLVSISQRKLFGTGNSYNRNFKNKNKNYNYNLGQLIDIRNGKFVAGKPIVSFELFSERYNLITNTLIEGYNYGDSVPLSAINYNWGWGLVTGTKEQSGYEIADYYNFYEHLGNSQTVVYDNIIDFESDMTTLTPNQSSFDDWSKYGGSMDKILSYGLYKGLKLL
jgi:hypothetical protein